MDVAEDIRRMGRAERISRQAMRWGASQDPHELHLAIEMVLAFGPRTMAEIGCDRGGTLFAWRQACDRVYGITLPVNADSGGAECRDHGARVLYADSHDEASRDWLLMCLSSLPLDILVIDGDHHLEGVTADLAMYGPLVRPGGLVMIHDVLPEEFPEVHVWKLWPSLEARYHTEVLGTTLGWGVIHVMPGDTF